MSGQKFTGFKMKASSSKLQSAYPLPAGVRQGVAMPSYGSAGLPKKRLTEEEYFDDGEEEVVKGEYQKASDSEESEEDPLDAFMSGIEVIFINFFCYDQISKFAESCETEYPSYITIPPEFNICLKDCIFQNALLFYFGPVRVINL